MSIQHINSISNRLSLRPPQRDSLEILARVCEIIELSKDADPVSGLWRELFVFINLAHHRHEVGGVGYSQQTIASLR